MCFVICSGIKRVRTRQNEPLMESCKERALPWREFQDCLDKGYIRFIRVGFLRQLAREGLGWPYYRQVPAEAYVDGDPSPQRVYLVSYQAEVSHQAKDSDLVFMNRMLVQKLDRLEVQDDELVHVNHMSCFSSKIETNMSAETRQQYDCVTKVSAQVRTDPRFRTIVLWELPPNSDFQPYREDSRCLYQLTMAAFGGNLIYGDKDIVDIIVNDFFLTTLRQKTFTNGLEDMDLVGNLFKHLLYERAGMSQLLDSS